MAYDEVLAGRLRKAIGTVSGLSEKKMFGGLALLINGNMAVAASSQGGILVRVDPIQTDELLASTSAQLMEMRGRTMQGWLRVSPEYIGSDDELDRWVQLSVAYALTLPEKS